MQQQFPLYTVDAFTSQPFCGNPAAVCLLSENLDAEICQKIAYEMNYSETAFVRLLNSADSFTKKNLNEEIYFETMSSGDLICSLTKDNAVSMDFPQWILEKTDESNELFLNIILETVESALVKDVLYAKDSKNLFIVLDDAVTKKQFENLKINTDKLLAIHPSGSEIKGISVSLKGSVENGSFDTDGNVYDFLSRYFAPWYGVPEDPVTGSLHCGLGPYWAKVLGKSTLYARQCSPRGGDLVLNIRSDKRIDLIGQSVIVISGFLTI